MKTTDLPVGIDLGTTNSLIGAIVEGSPRLFADAPRPRSTQGPRAR